MYLLGAGGSGEAWLSCDTAGTFGQAVVKVPHTWDWCRQDLKRHFQAESDALRRVSHPAIVTILDSGETEDGEQSEVGEGVVGDIHFEME